VTLGNFEGLLLYQRFRVPSGEVAAAYAAVAVQAAESIVEQLHRRSLSPATLEVAAWQFEIAVTAAHLQVLVGAGAAGIAAYATYSMCASLASSLSFASMGVAI
jgi:hypothetical protein